VPSNYEVYLCSDLGSKLKLLNDTLHELEYVRVVNDYGAILVTLNGYIDSALLQKDRQIQVWRRPPGGSLALDALGFLRWWSLESDGGERFTVLKAYDPNELLTRRIVAYDADDAKASFSDNADDGMKDIFNENFIGGVTDTDRSWAANDLTVQGDLGAGVSMEKAYSWRAVPDILRDVNEASRTDGTEVFFGVVVTGVDANNKPALEFQTWVGQPGQDRTQSGGSPVIFGEDWGNLLDPVLEFDYREEVNYVYVAGQGEGANRETAEVSDTDLISGSAWGRREAFKDARHVDIGNSAELTDEANTRLAEGRPRVRFTGSLIDSPQSRYGLDWHFGDKVTVQHAGYEFDGIIRSVRVQVDRDGLEEVDARIEAEITL